MRQLLDEFRSEGIILALDDFGTGYSSLRYLQVLNISRLKIDQSFIRHVVDDPHTEAIVTAILSLANALNLKTTAEGIETEAQLDFLTRRGLHPPAGLPAGPAHVGGRRKPPRPRGAAAVTPCPRWKSAARERQNHATISFVRAATRIWFRHGPHHHDRRPRIGL